MKKKMNDKGFSLVELIIVVAIMAILIGLLAPQYLKFVERSRKSADRDTVDEIIRSVQLDYADPESTFNVEGAVIVIKPNAAAEVAGTQAQDLKNVLASFGLQLENIKLKSSKWKQKGSTTTIVKQIKITFSYANDSIVATVTDDSAGVAAGTLVVDDSGNILGPIPATATTP